MEADDAAKFSDRIVETIKKIPVPIIFSVISISLLIIYWFIAIFLFHKDFYNRNTIQIAILFSFALSVTWFISSLGLSILTVQYLDKIRKDETDINGVLFIGGFASVIYLCFSILVTYIVRKYYPVNFDHFLLISYAYMALLILRICFAWFAHLVGEKK